MTARPASGYGSDKGWTARAAGPERGERQRAKRSPRGEGVCPESVLSGSSATTPPPTRQLDRANHDRFSTRWIATRSMIQARDLDDPSPGRGPADAVRAPRLGARRNRPAARQAPAAPPRASVGALFAHRAATSIAADGGASRTRESAGAHGARGVGQRRVPLRGGGARPAPGAARDRAARAGCDRALRRRHDDGDDDRRAPARGDRRGVRAGEASDEEAEFQRAFTVELRWA